MRDATVDRTARVRLRARPGEPGVVQLVLLDHQMVPTPDDVAGWVEDARRHGASTVRTSALFPSSSPAFVAAGFVTIDRLALLARELHPDPPRRSGRTRRMRSRDVPLAAEIDRAAFGERWANDAEALDEIGPATPHHRARVVGRPAVGFAISGRAGRTGYVQRLAVRPDHQRAGIGRTLLDDALGWMVRHAVHTALVNTGVGNEPALALYRSAGFRRRPDELVVMERSIER